MSSNEWALVIFTVIMQMAVGAFCILGGVHFFATRSRGLAEADQLSDRALYAIGPVAVFALVVTFLHLGNPINAPRAIMNLGSSWLSREILLALLFSAGGAVFAFLQWRKLATPVLRNVLGLIVAALGLVLVYAMSMVYRIPSVPAWNTSATTASFFLTTFLLGGLAMGAAFVANFWYMHREQKQVSDEVQYGMLATSLRWIALLSIVVLGLQLIVLPLYLSRLSASGSPAAAATLSMLANQEGMLMMVRLVLLFVGAGLLSLFVYTMVSSQDKLRVVSNIAYLAFALVLISEVLGRYLFYATMVRIGI